MGHYECKKCEMYYDECKCGEIKITEEKIEKKTILKAKELAKKPFKLFEDQKPKDEFFVHYMIETNREDNKEVKAIQEKAYSAYLKVAEKLSDEEIEIIKHAMRVRVIY